MQLYTVHLSQETALHVSGGISTHHQEHIQLYLQNLVLVNRYCYLPLLWESWSWSECGVGIVLICDVFCGRVGAGLSVVWELYRSVTSIVGELELV